MTWTVYVATIPDGRQYVGFTSKSLDERRRHWGGLKSGTGVTPKPGVMWGWAVRCCGRDHITIRALSRHATLKEAGAAERAAIIEFNTRLPHGFNKSPGGGGGRKPWPKNRRDIIRLKRFAGHIWPPAPIKRERAA